MTRPRNPQSGVTLLEVMIVLAVIALIVGFGAPRLMESFGRAKSQAAEVAMANLKGAVQLFYIDTGRYPTEGEGLAALLTAPEGQGDPGGTAGVPPPVVYLPGSRPPLDLSLCSAMVTAVASASQQLVVQVRGACCRPARVPPPFPWRVG